MESLPHDFAALCLLIFVLGMKHGFDAEHLATSDGLTRFNARTNPRLARFCGALFSLGHGAVVVAIALFVGTLARQWQIPLWLESFGTWVSIAFLAALGLLNIHAVLRTPAAQMVQPLGLKGRFLGRLSQAAHPLLIALVGALFALSFDTISQAALFALTAAQIGGWQHALLLGLIFMLGMLVTDGVNGLWISRLICRADQLALIASRVMSLVVAGISLLVAAFGLMKLLSPSVEAWSEGKDMLFGFGVVCVISVSFLAAHWLTRSVAVSRPLGATD